MRQSLEIPKSALEAELNRAMQWRYATKQFDRNKRIAPSTFGSLLNLLRLTPSSLGLQPWKFLVIENPALRQELRLHSWDQPQVTDASHFIVLCSLKRLDDELVKRYLGLVRKEWRLNEDSGQSMQNLYRDFLSEMSAAQTREWMGQQVYIALGNLITSAALLGIDTCPIEAFNKPIYNELLQTDRMNAEARVAVALGYRHNTDLYANHERVRFPEREIVFVR